jgi:hypothetical protein
MFEHLEFILLLGVTVATWADIIGDILDRRRARAEESKPSE